MEFTVYQISPPTSLSLMRSNVAAAGDDDDDDDDATKYILVLPR